MAHVVELEGRVFHVALRPSRHNFGAKTGRSLMEGLFQL